MGNNRGQALLNRPAAVHEELLQNANYDTLLAVGEECYRVLVRAAKKWDWVADTPGLDRMQDVTEFKHVPPLYRRSSVVVAPSHAHDFRSTEVSLQTLGNHWKRATRRLQSAEALFCRRATEMGDLFDTFWTQRNRLYHERGDIGLEDAGVLASSVLLLVKLAGSDLVEPERLEPLSVFSWRALGVFFSNGAPSGDTGEAGTVGEPGEGAASWAEHMDVLARIERNQESLLAQIDGLPPAIYTLMEDRDTAPAVSNPSADAVDDAPDVPVSSLSQRRDALMQLRNRIYMQHDIEPWHNICQRPIVDALLAREKEGRGIRVLADLFEVPEFKIKYERHPSVMKPLVEAYGREMIRLVAGGA